MQDAAKHQSDNRHNEAFDPAVRELKKSRRYETGDKAAMPKLLRNVALSFSLSL